jgi:hypothetical protein
VDLQQAEAVIDRLVEPQLLDQQVDRPDAAVDGRPAAVGDLLVDVGGGHHRPGAAAVVASVPAAEHAPLASFDLLSYLGVHSKTSVRRGAGL